MAYRCGCFFPLLQIGGGWEGGRGICCTIVFVLMATLSLCVALLFLGGGMNFGWVAFTVTGTG